MDYALIPSRGPFEGHRGPYLQYAHVRLCSIQRKVALTKDQRLQADFSLLEEPHAIDSVRLLAQYPGDIGNTFRTLEPTTILTYLFRLTHQLRLSYDVLIVVGATEDMETTIARVFLYEAARQMISCGMKLLGLKFRREVPNTRILFMTIAVYDMYRMWI